MADCSYCGAKILWARQPNGVRVPLDPTAPTFEYNPTTRDCLLVGQQQEYYRPVMVSHFATCPKVTRAGQPPVSAADNTKQKQKKKAALKARQENKSAARKQMAAWDEPALPSSPRDRFMLR